MVGNDMCSGTAVHMSTHIIHNKHQVAAVQMLMPILLSGSTLLFCSKHQGLVDESMYASRYVSYMWYLKYMIKLANGEGQSVYLVFGSGTYKMDVHTEQQVNSSGK
jgi:hypothetical protein